jgi:hypothetical protein
MVPANPLLLHATKDAIVIVIRMSRTVAEVNIGIAVLPLHAIRITHFHLPLVGDLVGE